MRKKLLTVLFIIYSFVNNAQNSTVNWVQRFGGGQFKGAVSIALDASGNIYTTGSFTGTADFDPGPGVQSLTATGIFDVYVMKSDPNGNLIWVKQFKGNNNNFPTSIALDAAGNVYTAGYFDGTIDFDPGAGVFELTNFGGISYYDGFVCKLDNNGNLIWAKQFGGSSVDAIKSMTVSPSGNVYANGGFQGVFDASIPGPGNPAGFIFKLSTAGDLVWAKPLVIYFNIGFASGLSNEGIKLDAFENVYSTGSFLDTVDFDPGPGEYRLYTDRQALHQDATFIVKLTSNGDFVFAKQFEGYCQPRSIALDASGNIYTTGLFLQPTDFDPGPGSYILTNTYYQSSFISKLDASGNFVWAKQLSGAYQSTAHGIATDPGSNVYITGEFIDQVDFDPGPGVYNLSSSQMDLFVMKLNPAGDFVWAKKGGGCDTEFGNAVVSNLTGTVYVAGYLESTPTYVDNLVSSSPYNTGSVLKISDCSNCPSTLCIGNRVWWDLNNNGIDDNEPGLEGLTVNIYRDTNNDNIPDNCYDGSTVTDANGNYSFCGLAPGNYIVGVMLPYGYRSASVNGGDPDNNIDKDNNGVSEVDGEVKGRSITLTPGGEPGGNVNNTYDFGLSQGQFTIGSRVWNDVNNNGRDDNEPGLEGVSVNIYKVQHNNDPYSSGTYITGTATDANGNYSFEHLFPGKYIVVVENPYGYYSSTVNGGDPNNNKDGDDNGQFTDEFQTWGLAMTIVANNLPDGYINNTYDFGFYQQTGTINRNISMQAESNTVISSASYPNPFTDVVNLLIDAGKKGNAAIEIIDGTGKVIRKADYDLNQGKNILALKNLSSLPKAIYFIRIRFNDQLFTHKLIKQ